MKKIISASRRTDIPAYYLDRLIDFIKQGYAEVLNPYSGKISRVSLLPETVHTLVLWSKDFGKFLKVSDSFKDFNLYFLFTVNDMPSNEPRVPPLHARLEQAVELAHRFGHLRIGWRFDPVIFTSKGSLTPVETYRLIGGEMAKAGIRRSIFSFLDIYGKVRTRINRLSLDIIDPPLEVKREYAARLAAQAAELGMSLESCSEILGEIEGITHSSCIDGRLLSSLSGEPAPLVKDTSQRSSCLCTVSRDIGSYGLMPCPHGCLYCYANPQIPTRPEKAK
jgi:DNA repair photolyase